MAREELERNRALAVRGLTCIRCEETYGDKTLFEGCVACREAGMPANVTVEYQAGRRLELATRMPIAGDGEGMWRYRSLLPLREGEVSLGEGLTPEIPCPSLARESGVRVLTFKDESRNPTWSYKDRLASVAVSRAKLEAARGVAVASTGNHGAAAAAYAAKGGIPCLVLTVRDVPDTMKLLMQAYGAMLVATERPLDRWVLLERCVRDYGWYSVGNYVRPPVGSSPYGIEGYKTIAYELAERREWSVPDAVVMPVAYGDGLFGVYKGFRELVELGLTERVPRLVAVETAGPLSRALDTGSETVQEVPSVSSVAFSINTPISTYQALTALRESDGTAVKVSDEEILYAQRVLARRAGIFAEASSAAVLAGIGRLVGKGWLTAEDAVVAILTSTGLKDPLVIRDQVPPVPVIEPRLEDLRRALWEAYEYDLTSAVPGDA